MADSNETKDALPDPNAQEGKETETENLGPLRKKLTIRSEMPPAPSAPTEITPAAGNPEEDVTKTQGILDPTRRRETDTTSLKRIKPRAEGAAPVATTTADGQPAPEDTTETIHLKVIRERKSQLKNILSSSQTIRLRPSAEGAAAPAQPGATVETPAVEQAEGKKTLKIKAPDIHETKTANLGKTLSAVTRQVDPGASTQPATLAPATPTTGGLQSPKSTLRIKAPPSIAQTQQAAAVPPAAPPSVRPAAPEAGVGTDTTGPVSRKATLKIKAPVAGQTQQAAAAPAAAPDQTMKQPAASEAGKPARTLKLKGAGGGGAGRTVSTPSIEAGAAPAGQGATQMTPAARMPAPSRSPGDEPGILYTLGAVASLAVAAGVVVVAAYQYSQLW